MDTNEKYRIARMLFNTLREDRDLHNQWLTDIFLVSLFNTMFGDRLTITKSFFNTFMVNDKHGFKACDIFDETNTTGIFRKTYDHKRYYYITLPGVVIGEPMQSKQWAKDIVDNQPQLPITTNTIVEHRTPSIINNVETTTTSPSHTTSTTIVSTNTPTVTAITTPKPDTLTSTLRKGFRRKSHLDETKVIETPRVRKRIEFISSPPVSNPVKVIGGTKAMNTIKMQGYEEALRDLGNEFEAFKLSQMNLHSLLRKTKKDLDKFRPVGDTTNTTAYNPNINPDSNINNSSIINTNPDIVVSSIDNTIKSLGKSLANYRNQDEKVTKIIDATLKAYGMKNLPRKYARKLMQKDYFAAWKFGKFYFYISNAPM